VARPSPATLRVLYDHQIFDSQIHGGISRYFVELIRHAWLAGAPSCRLAALLSNNEYLRGASFPRPRRFFPNVRWLRKGNHLTAVNKRWSLHCIARGDFDLLHPTYYGTYFLPALGGRPFALTIHDMIHELYPHASGSSGRTAERKRLLAEKAAGIIAVSESTRQDVIRLLGVPARKVRTIHHGGPAVLERILPPPPGIGDPYVLFVGQRGDYKNFPTFLRAMAPLLSDDRRLRVVCAGGRAFSAAEVEASRALGVEGRVLHVAGPSDAALASLYQHARAFAFPSRYEGFGLPVLEAFAFGCPALLARSSSLPEIGGDAAAYFDPGDEASIREVVGRVLRDEPLRHAMIAAGHRRAREFSWERAARETWAYYAEIVGRPPPGVSAAIAA
jgi:glycosyltransferase involved in cell wall biosynthesis